MPAERSDDIPSVGCIPRGTQRRTRRPNLSGACLRPPGYSRCYRYKGVFIFEERSSFRTGRLVHLPVTSRIPITGEPKERLLNIHGHSCLALSDLALRLRILNLVDMQGYRRVSLARQEARLRHVRVLTGK